MKRITLVPLRNINPLVLRKAHGAHCVEYTHDLNVDRLVAVRQPLGTRALANFVWTVFIITFADRHHVIVNQIFFGFSSSNDSGDPAGNGAKLLELVVFGMNHRSYQISFHPTN